MAHLDKSALDTLIAEGCPDCKGKSLLFKTYVEGLLPLMAGEPVGKLTWVHDGERFLDGVYEVSCEGCKKPLFSSTDCPRCNAKDGLAIALSTPNTDPVPLACPRCNREEVRYIAFVPAKARFEGKRAEKTRTSVELHDDGFHGYRVDCKDCRTVREVRDHCPLCLKTS